MKKRFVFGSSVADLNVFERNTFMESILLFFDRRLLWEEWLNVM